MRQAQTRSRSSPDRDGHESLPARGQIVAGATQLLAEILDDADELGALVPLVAGEVEEVSGALDHGTSFWCAADGDAAATAELEEPFVAELAKGAEDGVGVDLEDRGEILGGWEAFAGFRFAVGDGPADLGGHLLVQLGWVVPIDLDREHSANDTSSISLKMLR